jgi:hypothetical protein
MGTLAAGFDTKNLRFVISNKFIFMKDCKCDAAPLTWVVQTLADLAYDTTEPHLGVYDSAAICVAEGQPYDEHWERIFASLDVKSLFKLSLRSRTMFQLVMQYVRVHMPDPCHRDEHES